MEEDNTMTVDDPSSIKYECNETGEEIKVKVLFLDEQPLTQSSSAKEVVNNELNSTVPEEQVVCKFFLENRCRFGDQCHNLHPSDQVPSSPKNNSKFKNAPKHQKKNRAVEDEPDSPRKPSMKTVENVISRILWDESLPEENFTIGYLDRFRGILEKPFTFFSWEDIASVDNYTFAIPKHRIQYFKYRGSKVWDKNERLDFVFGSTGSDGSIYDAMKKIDEKLLESPEQEEIPFDLSGFGFDVEEVPKVSQNVERFHPTHFICFRITDPDVIKTAHIIKEYIDRHEPDYKNYFISDGSLHITIALLKLDFDEIPNALEVFQSMCSSLVSAEEQMAVNIEGLDTFSRRILYGKVFAQPSFITFAENSLELLQKSGIRVVGQEHGYTPHLTLWKSARTLPREKRYINPILYQNFLNSHFGVQVVDNLHVCAIGEEKSEDGFYKCVASKFFQ